MDHFADSQNVLSQKQDHIADKTQQKRSKVSSIPIYQKGRANMHKMGCKAWYFSIRQRRKKEIIKKKRFVLSAHSPPRICPLDTWPRLSDPNRIYSKLDLETLTSLSCRFFAIGEPDKLRRGNQTIVNMIILCYMTTVQRSNDFARAHVMWDEQTGNTILRQSKATQNCRGLTYIMGQTIPSPPPGSLRPHRDIAVDEKGPDGRKITYTAHGTDNMVKVHKESISVLHAGCVSV